MHQVRVGAVFLASLALGTGGTRPMLLMAHIDVVDARREDWSFEPYEFGELDGWYYGRGTSHNKAGAAMLVANFLRLKREGFVPGRDLIVVLRRRRAPGREPARGAADLRAVALRNDAGAARRVSLNPYANVLLRTTCVATRLSGGHADNALPQVARATVNCRMLPDHSPDSVEAGLRRALADTAIALTPINRPRPSPPSPLRPDVMAPAERLAREMWPGITVVPEMSMGATDGRFTLNAGIPTYGVSAIFDDPNNVRAHSRDERVGVKAYHDAAEYWYRLVKMLATSDLKS